MTTKLPTMLRKYFELPETISAEEAKTLFEEILCIPCGPEDAVQIADAIAEIADKQWHTYQRLNPTTMEQLEHWVASHWNPHSLELTSTMISIIGTIGIPASAFLMSQTLKEQIPETVRKEITNLSKLASASSSTIRRNVAGLGCEHE